MSGGIGGSNSNKSRNVEVRVNGQKGENCLGETQDLSSSHSPLIPNHVAIICDGNGRWASKRGLGRLAGHHAGVETVKMVVNQCLRLGIRYLTLYTFSTENWYRPQEEVKGLLEGIILKELKATLTPEELVKNGIKIRTIGQRERLPKELREAILNAENVSQQCDKLHLTFAFSYGAREEILQAAKQLAIEAKSGNLDPELIDDTMFSKKLWTNELPDPDLLIRTGGEVRVSNFLLWQLSYAEFVFAPEHWPDFSKDSFSRCLEEWTARERRYGRTAVGAPKPFTDVVI